MSQGKVSTISNFIFSAAEINCGRNVTCIERNSQADLYSNALYGPSRGNHNTSSHNFEKDSMNSKSRKSTQLNAVRPPSLKPLDAWVHQLGPLQEFQFPERQIDIPEPFPLIPSLRHSSNPQKLHRQLFHGHPDPLEAISRHKMDPTPLKHEAPKKPFRPLLLNLQPPKKPQRLQRRTETDYVSSLIHPRRLLEYIRKDQV